MRFDTWAEFLDYQRRQPYMREISEAVQHDRLLGAVYPRPEDVFRFTETPLADVKVVILGQDPYHGRGQADGLAFSVREGVTLPPSLRNILRELADDVGVKKHANGTAKSVPYFGNLIPWTRQGVLLLNTALTVREGEAGSHCDIWQPFTDEVIRAVVYSAAARNFRPHFVLWGRKARAAVVRSLRHELCIADNGPEWLYYTSGISATYSAHPSPKSANLGFFGSRPFSRANLALTLNNPGCAPVDWRLS